MYIYIFVIPQTLAYISVFCYGCVEFNLSNCFSLVRKGLRFTLAVTSGTDSHDGTL